MGFLTTHLVLKIALELTLGVCMKLWCDNGRVHYRDFVNDFLFWVPGVDAQHGDGLTREVLGFDTLGAGHDVDHLPAAAK